VGGSGGAAWDARWVTTSRGRRARAAEPEESPLAATLRRVERASGALATQSVARMDELLPWFRSMPADQRSWVMLVAQAGIASFVEWLRTPGDGPRLTGDVFGTAPRELARSVSLKQVVELVRVTVEVVENRVDILAAPGEVAQLREAVLRYSREVAFAAAQVYAGVAETRGAWDARLEALVVDALLRGDHHDESLPGRASALGWAAMSPVTVVIGRSPAAHPEEVLDAVQRAARHAGADVLAGVHGDRLVVVLGGAADALAATGPLLPEFAPGPVVVGPTMPDLGSAGGSARAALAGVRAAPGWPAAPRPVLAEDLLPERALAGDEEARQELLETVYWPLADAGTLLLDTVTAYAEAGGSLEGTARMLFVHPNTVRYRLRRVSEVCSRTPADPRDLFTLQVALVLGRLAS
jgi:PucR C-terminal helix-turn-helix domain/GGDEF-like domain